MNINFAPRFSSLKINLMKEHGFPDSVLIGTGLGADRHVYIDDKYVGDNDLVGELTRKIASNPSQFATWHPNRLENMKRFRKHMETVVRACREQNLMDDVTFERALSTVTTGIKMQFLPGYKSKD